MKPVTDPWWALFVKFISISTLSTATYIVVAFVAGVMLGIDGKVTVVLAYLAALPLNFYGHRNFTFKSNVPVATQIVKFIAVHAVILASSAAVMFVMVDYFRLPLLFGLIVSTAAIMVLSFVLLSGWVFWTKA